MSSEYDDSVENNSDPVISEFLSEEIRITSELCQKIIKPDSKYTVIDLGSGTGRILFALNSILGDSIQYRGLDASKPMVDLSNKKLEKLGNDNISFLHYDVTNSEIDGIFDDSIKIVMCMYNTIGVIPAQKKQQFFDSMIRLAGQDGLAIISAFNGDDFAFVSPKIYTPMKNMVQRIDEDSFDEEKRAFRNSLGYYSQWFTKNQILDLLHSETLPIPINISLNNEDKTFGNVFTNREV